MKKVLVLDDDHDIAEVVKLVLEMNGYQGEAITNFRELDAILFSYNPDVLVLDISLGGADGRDLCRKLKANKDLQHIHVILFSANRDASNHYKEFNAEAFIPKPFDTKQLINTIEGILSRPVTMA